jgi:hypothetical protein
MTNPRFQTTRTQSGQKFQLQSGAIARGGGGLAAVSPHKLANPPSTNAEGEYDPGDLIEIDKAIRHLPGVVAYCKQKAEQTIEMTGSENFEVIVSDNPANTRARAYVAPANNKGIHEELSEHVALKAAINMEGK